MADPTGDPLSRSASVAGAAVAALVVVPTTLSLASIVYRGPLAGALGLGVTAFLVGTALMNLGFVRESRFPGTLVQPQDATTAVAATTVAGVAAATVADGIATAMLLLVVTTALGGVALYALGRLRLGRLAQYVPQPVLGGFIAGTGWLLVVAAVGLAGDGGSSSVVTANLVVAGTLSVLLLVATRTRLGVVGFPALLVLATLAVHGWLLTAGTDLAAARADGLLLSPPDGPLVPVEGLGRVDWAVLAASLPAAGAVVVVAALGLVLNVGALAATFDREVDVDAELRAVGAGNLLAAATGAPVGYHGLGSSVVALRIGARGRAAPLAAAGLSLLVAAVGRDVLGLIPVGVLAAVPLMIGLDLMDSWVRPGWRRMPRDEYALMLAIVVAIVALGFLAGVVVGLVATSLLFVVAYARRDPVRTTYLAADRRSSHERSPEQEEVLRVVGTSVRVVELEGHLFFGSATAVASTLREQVAAESTTTLVIDLAAVPRMDSTAGAALGSLTRGLRRDGVGVVVCGVRERLRGMLDPTTPDDVTVTAEDLDHVLEELEERVLRETDEDGRASGDGDGRPRGGLARRLAAWDHLVTSLPEVPVSAGEVLTATDDAEDDVEAWLISAGRVTAEVRRDGGGWRRVGVVEEGGIIGEVRLWGGVPRSARLRAEVDSRLHPLTVESLALLERDDPDSAIALHRAVAGLLAERLANVNRLRRSADW